MPARGWGMGRRFDFYGIRIIWWIEKSAVHAQVFHWALRAPTLPSPSGGGRNQMRSSPNSPCATMAWW